MSHWVSRWLVKSPSVFIMIGFKTLCMPNSIPSNWTALRTNFCIVPVILGWHQWEQSFFNTQIRSWMILLQMQLHHFFLIIHSSFELIESNSAYGYIEIPIFSITLRVHHFLLKFISMMSLNLLFIYTSSFSIGYDCLKYFYIYIYSTRGFFMEVGIILSFWNKRGKGARAKLKLII